MKINDKKYLFIIGAFLIILVIVLIYINRTNIYLENNTLEVKKGEEQKIEYHSNKDINITWESENNSIATVDNNGYVTGIGVGNTNIIGTYYIRDKKNILTCNIMVYQGNKDIDLNNIIVPDGEVIMQVKDSYDIPYTITPSNAYFYDIVYEIDDDSIISVENGKIISKKVGTASIKIIINKKIEKKIKINVVDEEILATMGKMVQEVKVSDKEITVKNNEKKEVLYEIVPNDAYIYRFKLESSDSNILEIDDKYIVGKKEGSAQVSLTINNITTKLTVKVITSVEKIVIDYYPKNVIKVDESLKINAKASPNPTEELLYTSSNPAVLEVNGNQITGKSQGVATVTITDKNNSVKETLNFNVFPRVGVVGDTNVFWQYKSLNSKVPKRADVTFFQKLVANGKGTMENNVYIYSKDNVTYRYDIKQSILSAGGKRAFMRIYYPENEDLSTLNTFNFMGGDGERDFNSLFNEIDKNPAIIQSGGIIILMCDSNINSNIEYTGAVAINATKFVMAITDQKEGVKNSIGGYSTGGTKIMQAANNFEYDKYIIFNSYYNWPTSANGAMNKDVIFYSPKGDHLSPQRDSTLAMMTKVNYTNVTIITNDSDFINKYGKHYLVINAGSAMDNGHGSGNITKSGLFAYACD